MTRPHRHTGTTREMVGDVRGTSTCANRPVVTLGLGSESGFNGPASLLFPEANRTQLPSPNATHLHLRGAFRVRRRITPREANRDDCCPRSCAPASLARALHTLLPRE